MLERVEFIKLKFSSVGGAGLSKLKLDELEELNELLKFSCAGGVGFSTGKFSKFGGIA